METNKREPRFYSAKSDRCYRVLTLPINVEHIKSIDFSKQNLSEYKETVFTDNRYWDTNFCSWLDSLGLEIKMSRLFTNRPGMKYNLHVDISNYNDQTAVINFPFDDSGSIFSWYNLREDGKITVKPNSNGIPLFYFDPDECIEIIKTEIVHGVNQPILINTGYIHSVEVAMTDRYCFSYFLKKKNHTVNLQWDDAVKVFEPFLI